MIKRGSVSDLMKQIRQTEVIKAAVEYQGVTTSGGPVKGKKGTAPPQRKVSVQDMIQEIRAKFENVTAGQETAHAVRQYVYLAAVIVLFHTLDESLELLGGRAILLPPIINELKQSGIYLVAVASRVTVGGDHRQGWAR